MLNGSKGTLYRGRWGMWSWVAHRITGIQAKNKDGNVEISQKATYTHIKILWVVLFLWAITVAGFAARHLPIVFSHMGGH